jgi:hypothetical protein
MPSLFDSLAGLSHSLVEYVILIPFELLHIIAAEAQALIAISNPTKASAPGPPSTYQETAPAFPQAQRLVDYHRRHHPGFAWLCSQHPPTVPPSRRHHAKH